MNSSTYAEINAAAANLVAISRAEQRQKINRATTFAGYGEDVWRTSELTWLDIRGKPKRGDLRLTIACDSPNLIESKSLKLYLMSFAMTVFESKSAVAELITSHLSSRIGSVCEVDIDTTARGFSFEQDFIEQSHRLDYIPLGVSDFVVSKELLAPRRSADRASGRYHTDLFRCLCPISSQPDYATIAVTVKDAWLSAESLLSYLLSYRNHQGFHESTVEQIFYDVQEVCQPSAISVLGSFARRGGIDICPFRSSEDETAPNWRSGIC